MSQGDNCYQPEVIYVNKVYNECSIVDCPTYRIPIPPTFPLAVNVVECEVTDIVVNGVIPRNGQMNVEVNFVINIEYDSNGTSQFLQQTAQYRRNGIILEGAVPEMTSVILPLVRCINCNVTDGGTIIECEVGVYLILKAVALVQLEVMGRFPDEPPICEEVSPQGCAEWIEFARSGALWPPFPPQPPRCNNNNNNVIP